MKVYHFHSTTLPSHLHRVKPCSQHHLERPPPFAAGPRPQEYCFHCMALAIPNHCLNHLCSAGLRPQEYYFHCMAGREGLVDTTVKTSRSGEARGPELRKAEQQSGISQCGQESETQTEAGL